MAFNDTAADPLSTTEAVDGDAKGPRPRTERRRGENAK